jgi:hypothetical protein
VPRLRCNLSKGFKLTGGTVADRGDYRGSHSSSLHASRKRSINFDPLLRMKHGVCSVEYALRQVRNLAAQRRTLRIEKSG